MEGSERKEKVAAVKHTCGVVAVMVEVTQRLPHYLGRQEMRLET